MSFPPVQNGETYKTWKKEFGRLEAFAQYKTENEFVENESQCFEMKLNGYRRTNRKIQWNNGELGSVFMHWTSLIPEL